MSSSRSSAIRDHAAALVAVLAAYGVTSLTWPLLQPTPMALFYAAIVAATWVGGARAGAPAVLVSAALGYYAFIPPYGAFGTEPKQLGVLAVFLSVASTFVGLIESRQLAATREREQRRWFAGTLASVGDAVIATDTEGRVRFMNDVAERLTGWTARDARGRELEEVFAILDEESRGPAESPIKKALETGRIVGLSNHTVLVSRDGRETPIEDSAAPIRDDAGSVRGVILVFRDATETRRAQLATEEAKRQTENVLESITDGFIALDRDWRFTYVNEVAERLTGMKREELLGKDQWELFPATLGTPNEVGYRRAMERLETVEFENYYEPWRRWFLCKASPARDGGIVVYFRDITARKRAEEERDRLAEESERQRRIYEAALSNTPDLVYIFDLDHRFLYANEALLAMWGRTREEALGRNCLELGYEPWHAEMHDREIEQVVATKEPIRGEVPFAGTNGRRIYDYIFAPVLGGDGSVVAVAGSTRDVTDRKRDEEALRESEGRFRLAQLAANIGTYDWDLGTNEVAWSEGIFRSVGLEPGSVRPTLDLWLTFLHPEDREGSYTAVREAIASGREYYYEFRVVLENGEVRWLASRGRAVHDQDGAPVRFLGVNVDITALKRAGEEAREHEVRFRQIADNLPGGVIYQAVPGPAEGTARFSYVSRGVERLFGFTPEEIAERPELLFGLVHEADAPRVMAANAASLRDAAPFDQQFRSYTRDGSLRWVHARSAPRPAAGGGIVWDGVALDVTAQKSAEARQALLAEAGRILGSSLDYGRTLADVCRLVVPVLADWCTLDLLTDEGEVRRVEVAHVDPEKVALAHELRRRYPPDPADERGLMKVLKTGEPEVYEEVTDELLRLGARDDEHYRIMRELGLRSAIIVPLIARGRTLGALSLVTAESSRRYGAEDVALASELASRAALAVDNARLFRGAEEAARRRDEALAVHRAVEVQLTLLVQASGSLSASLEPAAVLDAVVSLSRRLIAADAYAVWRHEETTGRWGISTASGLSDEYRLSTIQVLETTPTLPDGPIVAEDVLASPLLAGRRPEHEREGVASLLAVPLKVHGRGSGTLTFYYRTPHRFTEVEVRVATALANLASAAIGTSELYEALKENDRKKDEFLAMLAHELRNPLSAIANAVQLVQRSSAEEHLEWAKDVIDKHVRSLSRMIDDLLDVSRITRGKIELKRRVIDVLPVVSHAIETVRPLVEERGHELILSQSSAPMWVDADPHRLEQVVVNLLNNAAKYTESPGRIELSVLPDGDSVALRVADNGCGIPPDKLPQMFELFAQGDRSIARSEGGLGIGLTIVRSLVEMHGGSVTARSEGPGTGSEFTVRLPAATPPRPERPRRALAAGEGTRPGSRVLVVDDNEDSARGLGRLLKVLGHDVEIALDGPSAIESALGHRPEFILLDIGLPGMDGYEVARRLRADGFTDVTIIAVSGYGEEAARSRSREAGFDHHLVKPVDYEKLVAIMRRAH